MLRDLSTLRSIEDIRLFYFKYKDSPEMNIAGVACIFFVSLAILWTLVFPQITQWSQFQKEIKELEQRIAILQKNQQFIASIDKTKLDSQYALTTKALPFQKDYSGIIEAIDYLTQVSGMTRSDYSIAVGNLSTKSAELAPETAISIDLSLIGDSDKFQKLLSAINTLLPLAETISASFSNDSETASVQINFFYKYLPPDVLIGYTTPIRRLNKDNIALLDVLAKWKDDTKTFTPDTLLPDTQQTSQSGTLNE